MQHFQVQGEREQTIGSDIDKMVQIYLKKLREDGGAVSARIAISAANGILLACDKAKLDEYRGPIALGKPWAHSLLNSMGYV